MPPRKVNTLSKNKTLTRIDALSTNDFNQSEGDADEMELSTQDNPKTKLRKIGSDDDDDLFDQLSESLNEPDSSVDISAITDSSSLMESMQSSSIASASKKSRKKSKKSIEPTGLLAEEGFVMLVDSVDSKDMDTGWDCNFC